MATIKPIVQGQLPTGDYQPLQLDNAGNLKTTGGAGGGGGDVRITDGSVAATITDVAGKKSLDVNVTDITLSHLNDSVVLGDATGLITSTVRAGKRAIDVNSNIDEKILIDEVDSNTTFVGFALPGTVSSSALFKIKKITANAVLWADGVATYDKVWDNRNLYTYS